MSTDSPTSATGGFWRTLLIIWVTVMAGMYAVAVTWSQGATPALQIFGYGIPLLTAMLAFRGVRETLRHKQSSDDHAHWWDQTKWAFDLVMSPHAQPQDLQMAADTLQSQISASGLPDRDLDVAIRMLRRAEARVRQYEKLELLPYTELSKKG
ncbi:hypothetical protein [uncultured Corynebacterium sp.]|uniref:hypothetical protein n=1 Tax=uncultured Corynebacterium sp. TaxID=159447 RepID=UPI0025EB987B|nr:hypothetical protein [uncultured Corynebacterium sp.]